MKYIKTLMLALGLVLLSGLIFVGAANAQSFKTGNSVGVAAGETIDGMLFAGGSNIDIAGTVNGDVYCGGQTITISGTVNGDVICGGQTISISGKIDGSVRLGGQTVTLSGTVGNSATIGAQDLIIEKNAVITRDLLGGSQNVTINGSIGRDMVSGAEAMTINGKVARDIKGGFDTLTIGPAGLVGGKVDYTGTSDPTIQNGGKILGQVTRTAPKDQSETSANPVAAAIGGFVYVFLSMILLSMVVAGLFPRTLIEASEKAIKRPGKTILVGLLAAMSVPALIIVLMITFIGIPLAVLLILVWIAIIILCTPFVGYTVGSALLRNKNQKTALAMLLGVSILFVTYFIPFVGFITAFATYIFGTGVILSQGQHLILRPTTKNTK